MLTTLKALWTTEPVRVATLLAAITVAVLAQVGIVIDEADLIDTIVLLVPLVLGGELARQRVTPYAGEPGVPSDQQPDFPASEVETA